ncbi:MAG: hypothetical protein ACRENS_04285 [Candidatus Eiseniibacteriota bacterium]
MSAPAPTPKRSAGSGLRVRLWIGCLAGPVLCAVALAVISMRGANPADAEFHWVLLPAALGGAFVLSLVLAIWLDRGIVRHLRGLERSMAQSEVTDLRGLPSSSGWGEISSLTIQAQALLARQRQAARTASELEHLSARLIMIRDGVDQWTRTQVWTPMVPEGGAIGALVGVLNRELPRLTEWQSGGRELADALLNDIGAGMPEAREVAEQAERGFVEATALLTTVRELERLGGELDAMLAVPAKAANERSLAAEQSLDQFRASAAEAIEGLIAASSESVGHLAEGLAHVQEIGERTRLIANRTTLVALNALTANARPAGVTTEMMHGELKALATDVREASDRVDALTTEIDRQAMAARERMTRARSSIAGALEAAFPAPGDTPAAPGLPDPTRVMERVREMIRDAAAKGERLSSAGERVSRAAAKLQRRVESEVTSVGQLAASLELEGQAKIVSPANSAARLRVVESPREVAPEKDETPESHDPAEAPGSPEPPPNRGREESQ